MIKVDPGAQRTDAFQESRNLLLTDGAHADAIPGLEIEANDVRCTHAATVARLDEDQLFYLQSRGLTRAEAERLLVGGFLEVIAGRLEDSPFLHDAVSAALAARARSRACLNRRAAEFGFATMAFVILPNVRGRHTMTELQRYLAEEVAEDHADGIITRREAMRRLGLLGVGGAVASTMLAAPQIAFGHRRRHKRGGQPRRHGVGELGSGRHRGDQLRGSARDFAGRVGTGRTPARQHPRNPREPRPHRPHPAGRRPAGRHRLLRAGA